MTTIAATDDGVLAAGRRVVALRRRAATAVAMVFFAVGWLVCWVTPPVLVALARWCGAGIRWCAAAAAVGWADARKAAASGGGASGGNR